MIAGVVVVAAFLLLAGWWLRGAAEQPTVASPPPATPAAGEAMVTAEVASPEPDLRDRSPQESPSPDRLPPEDEAPPPDAAADGEEGPARGVPKPLEKEEPGAVKIAGSRMPVASPDPKPTPAAPVAPPDPKPTPAVPVAIEAPLLAQAGTAESSSPPPDVRTRGADPPDEPPVGIDAAAPTPPAPVAEPPRAADPPVQKSAPAPSSEPTLRIARDEMSAGQRSYLARVIRFLEPPLEYEWIPKYTRPGLFTSLVTDGPPPECRIDFKGPTVITFDLIIRGGSGTESRIEDVEITYR